MSDIWVHTVLIIIIQKALLDTNIGHTRAIHWDFSKKAGFKNLYLCVLKTPLYLMHFQNTGVMFDDSETLLTTFSIQSIHSFSRL